MKTKKGDMIVFNGYGADVPEEEQYLTAGEQYEVSAVDVKEKSVDVVIDNPNFNPKQKANDKTNPKTLTVVVFEEEFAPAEAAEEEATAPKGKAAAKAAPVAAKGKAAAKAAPVAAKGKAAAKAAPAKGKIAKKEEQEEANADPYADLDEADEDQAIVELVNESGDLLELAKEIIEEQSAVEYKLGGILFHIRKDGAYKELDGRYADNGGFGLYVLEQLNTEYRKAMYLIDIYYKFNKFGIPGDTLQTIGWAKAAKIAAVMDADNAEELVTLASENTLVDVIENIKTTYKDVGAKGTSDKKRMTTFKFRLFEDQAVAVEETLQAVAGSMGFKRIDDAFEHIIMEWAAEHPIDVPKAAVGKKVAAPAKAVAKKPVAVRGK